MQIKGINYLSNMFDMKCYWDKHVIDVMICNQQVAVYVYSHFNHNMLCNHEANSFVYFRRDNQ